MSNDLIIISSAPDAIAAFRQIERRQQQPSSDDQIMALWLHVRSEHTQDAYKRDVAGFLSCAGCELRAVSLSLLQNWVDIEPMRAKATASRAHSIAAVKSLFSFAYRSGYLPFNVAALLKSPKAENKLAERILEESQVSRILSMETNPRNAVMLRLLYAAGIRVSELCGLR